MKKKIMTALCLMTLGLGMTTSVFAANSKESTPVDKTTPAPDTGDSNTAAAAVGAALALGGVVVISKKKIAE